jgi:hypothetical protein
VARFNKPTGVAVDSAGNVYVADTYNGTIRKLTPDGVVTTLAGNPHVAGSADGTGSLATFSDPWGAAVDSAGNVFVGDSGNQTVRRVSPEGVVTTLAGSPGIAGDVDATGSAARFYGPSGLTTDNAGNVYVADASNGAVRQVTSEGAVTTVASGFALPLGVAVDSAGNTYVAEASANDIRQVTTSGMVSTLASSAAGLDWPTCVAAGRSGDVYVADTNNSTISVATSAGMVTTLAGTLQQPGASDGPGAAATFNRPVGIAASASGIVYVADTQNDTIRMITAEGIVTTPAGKAPHTGSADGVGPAARFNGPGGVAVDGAGNTYVVDANNDTVRKVSLDGTVTTLAGDPGQAGTDDGVGSAARFGTTSQGPSGIAVDGAGNLYVADTPNSTIRKVTADGAVTTLAGTAGDADCVDGTGNAALFIWPVGVAVDSGGNVFVADGQCNTIRRITPAGVVTTLAGDPTQSGSTDGTGANASFSFPSGVAVDASDNVYVADMDNATIRKITPEGVVTTLAGNPGLPGSTDGSGSAASFSEPANVAVDGAGVIYVADVGNNAIRRVTPGGIVTTVVGVPGVIGANTGPLPALLSVPQGLAVGPNGDLALSDENALLIVHW